MRDERTQPAMPARRRHPLADEVLLVVAGDGCEHELVGLLVEEEDRRCLRAEDRPRDLDDRAQQAAELLLGREHAGRDRRLVVLPVVAHRAPPTFADVR